MILGDFADGGSMDWLHYEWLEPYTKTQEQVDVLNDKFKNYNWKFKMGGLRHWAGAQCTGKEFREIVLNCAKELTTN